MKPTAIVIVGIVTAFVIGVGSIQLFVSSGTTDDGQPTGVPTTTMRATGLTDIVSPKPAKKERQDDQTQVEAAPEVVEEQPKADRLEYVSIKPRKIKTTKDHEYWTWRVVVKNNTDEVLTSFVEVEWIDEDGNRVDSDREVRKLSPGTCSISKVHRVAADAAKKVASVRVAELDVRADLGDSDDPVAKNLD